MSTPTPAVVAASSARRLPRLGLLLLCAAYVVPGVLGRDPWRNADLTAFAQMLAMAEGRTSWWQPSLGGVMADTALLPHWLGAAFIWALSPMVDPALAARLPFALLLVVTLALVWYSTFHLARTEAAQPVAFAFGGEASPVDYARAVADGAVLALMATLGLLLLGHETTPELAQLSAAALFLYALAAAPWRVVQARVAAALALLFLAGSGAPAVAGALGLGGLLVCGRSRLPAARALVPALLLATLGSVALAWVLGAWRWRAELVGLDDLPGVARQWLWFLWPVWPLALWTLWRWRRHLSHRHISVPLVGTLVAMAANLAMAGSDRALMLGLPGMAVLAAFALPTLRRSASAAVDWFSMLFFTAWAVVFWVHYVGMQTGVPVRPAANIARLAPGFETTFSLPALLAAALGTAAWLALVRWRTGRHRDALWKSLVLPAGGVALCWLLAMTLLLAPLNYLRSPRALVGQLRPHVPAAACVSAPGLSPPAVAALEVFGPWRVEAHPDLAATACGYLIKVSRERAVPAAPTGWTLLAQARRPGDRDEVTLLYGKAAAP
jgi:4-amino-4-deoxy-L-arabinose transferase-like glycosyltransferase